jgi:diguanylate cyclase (GGDEF)-like protein
MFQLLSRWKPSRPFTAYAQAVVLLALVGAWLTHDLGSERQRTLDEVSRSAIHQSQLISDLFDDTFLSADYVLRDIAGHVSLALAHNTFPASVTSVLADKHQTVRGLLDLTLIDQHCILVANVTTPKVIGHKSRQRFCANASHPPGQTLYIQYMPAEKSANGKAVVLMSRVIASPQGVMQAAAMAVMELDFAQQWIQNLTVTGNDVQLIIDTDGIVLAHNPPLQEGMGQGPGQGQRLGQRTSIPQDPTAFSAIQKTHSYTAQSPSDKRERLYGMTRLEQFPFLTIVGYDKAHALDNWESRAWQFALGFTALAVLLLSLIRANLRAQGQASAMEVLAHTDMLTSIPNRRQLFAFGEHEILRSVRHNKALTVFMIDIDHFKKINDRWGHPCGDRVIRHTAQTLRTMLRNVDICGRLGGEEFAAILPDTSAQSAYVIAERLRLAIEAADCVCSEDGQSIRFTVSLGLAELLPSDTDFDSILLRADQALYQAKEGGRNRTVVAS